MVDIRIAPGRIAAGGGRGKGIPGGPGGNGGRPEVRHEDNNSEIHKVKLLPPGNPGTGAP